MTDVWPRRNLGSGENWGRQIERRVEGISRSQQISDQSRTGLGRYTASTADEVARQARELLDALGRNPRYFSRSTNSSGFSFGPNWLTVASITQPAPTDLKDYHSCSVTATGVTTSWQNQTTTTQNFEWPFPLSSVTSEFGARPPLPYHRGIDFGQASGTPITAAHDGVVTLRGYYSDWGNYTRIDCTPLTGVANSWTGYAHMVSLPLYAPGTIVTRGQVIGYVGSTGMSTGAHLHFETALENERIDPRSFMDIFGGSGTITDLYHVYARIVINGVAGQVFQPYTDMGLSQFQLNYPINGASLSAVESVTVQLQIRLDGNATSSANSRNTASLTVRGGFQ